MALFSEIPRLIDYGGNGAATVDWKYLPHHVLYHVEEWELNFDPDFQRGYVWKPAQKVAYVEYILRGGRSGREIYTNCPGWSFGKVGNYVLVDGKQRLNAVLSWLNNEFPIFGGNYYRDYTDSIRTVNGYFNWHVNELATRDDVLAWYIQLNAGGTAHDPSEIARVQALIGQGEWEPWTLQDARNNVGLGRVVFDEARRVEAERAAKAPAFSSPVPTKRKRKR